VSVLGACAEATCDNEIGTIPNAKARAFSRDTDETENGLLASTSAFVLEPGASPCELSILNIELRANGTVHFHLDYHITYD